MDRVDHLLVARRHGSLAPAVIELLYGDLAHIPADHTVDLLVVSAFEDDYSPQPRTLFAAFFDERLDMREVARHKEEDERAHLGCWLSTPFPPEVAQRFRFTRILCFEPRHRAFRINTGLIADTVEAAVPFVFRCLNHFVIPDRDHARDFSIASVAMPLLATGNQGVAVDEMLPRLLEAAIFWLEQGLPIERLKIVVHDPAHLPGAASIFQRVSSSYQRGTLAATEGEGRPPDVQRRRLDDLSRSLVESCRAQVADDLRAAATADERPVIDALLSRIASALPEPTSADEYDVFISYAHKHDQAARELVKALQQEAPGWRIFFDRSSIPVGGQWIRLLSDAIQRSRRFVALLAPDYSASPVCWDEFQCAKLQEYNTRQQLIRTIRLYSEPHLPSIMGIYSYEDCAEGDLDKLRAAAGRLTH